MAKMSNPALLMQKEQQVLSVRVRTAVDKLPALIGQTYGRLAAYLGELGELMTDVPFVAYHNTDMRDLDVEIGFPIGRSLPGREEITCRTVPAGRIVFCMYRGAYDGIEPMYNEMNAWIRENGMEPAGSSYEYYYNGTEFEESDLLTKVVIPIQ